MGEQRQSALDGLRAVAAFAVLFYHAHALPGGSLGVDVFFVLSGYLITKIIASEIRETGALNIGRFLIRRARRLYPALIVLLVAYVALGPVLLPQFADLRWLDALFASLYLTNIVETLHYHERPLSHTWTLAVEGQFYLAWPLVMLALSRLRQRAALNVLLVAWLAITCARLLWPLGEDRNVVTVFFTPFHASGLVLGAALALAPAWRPLAVVGWIGLATLAVMFILPWSPFYLTGASAELAAAAVVASPPGFLAWRPLAFLGRISYGIYLWHLPIGLALGWPPGVAGVLAVAVPSVLIATLSYFAVERWFLRSPSQRSPAMVAG